MELVEDLCIMENFPDPEFHYRVAWIFPEKLYKEKIFQDNIRHTLSELKEIITINDALRAEKKLLEFLEFDSQIEKQKKVIEEYELKSIAAFDKLNEGISPYYWYITENVNQFIDRQHVRADYGLWLMKK